MREFQKGSLPVGILRKEMSIRSHLHCTLRNWRDFVGLKKNSSREYDINKSEEVRSPHGQHEESRLTDV